MFLEKLFDRILNIPLKNKTPLTLEELRNMNGCEVIVTCSDFPQREFRGKIIGDIISCPYAAIFSITERYGEYFVAYKIKEDNECCRCSVKKIWNFYIVFIRKVDNKNGND